MEQKSKIEILRPFGPSIAKVKIPEKLLNNLNEYIEEIILDEKKIAKQDHGSKLAGNVSQEFKLEEKFKKFLCLIDEYDSEGVDKNQLQLFPTKYYEYNEADCDK